MEGKMAAGAFGRARSYGLEAQIIIQDKTRLVDLIYYPEVIVIAELKKKLGSGHRKLN